MSRQSIGKILSEAAVATSEALRKHDLPALPNTTPHSLRRTYISIALLANNFDIVWVMKQVGHADSKMTLEVYAQLQQRARRENGAKFDALVHDAREQLTKRPRMPSQQSIRSAIGSATPIHAFTPTRKRHRHINQKAHISTRSVRLRNSDFELRTPRFSGVLYQLSYLAATPILASLRRRMNAASPIGDHRLGRQILGSSRHARLIFGRCG
jgi:hypothetical protein